MTQVHIRWQRRPSRPAAEPLRRAVSTALDRVGEGRAEVHVLVTGDEEIRELNRQYRGIDAATDVLSFPDGDLLPTGRRLLGQIVISVDRARVQGAELGHGETRELEELALHGTLHLLGLDHETDQGGMAELELELREELER